MKVVLLPVDAMPLVSASLVFDVGDAASPENPLLADLAASFLSLGAGSADSLDARDDVYFRDVVIKGLERLIKAGEYNQESLERWQKVTKGQYSSKERQQYVEYQRQFYTAIYGPDHPYTKTASVRDKHYSAANATLIVAGAFDVKKAESMVRGAFGGWGKGHKDAPVPPEQFQRTGPAYVGVIGKENPQMDVSIAYPAPAGIDGQEAARQVLAGMLNIRMGDIRFKLGSTYGTYARRQAGVGPSAYMLGGTVDGARAGESLKAMRDGVQRLRDGVEFDIDFVRARRKLIQSLLGESTVTSELTGRLTVIERFDLDPNYYNNLLQQIAAVSPAQVKALIASELAPSNEVIVTMADRATLTKAFADAGITDVKLVEPDYK
jgi:zinc protease